MQVISALIGGIRQAPLIRHRKGLRRRVAAGLIGAIMLLSLTAIAPPAATADTRGYAYLTYSQVTRTFTFNFGIPRAVLAAPGYGVPAVKGACAAYLGNALGLRWWMWWAPDIVCGAVVNQVTGPAPRTGVCGSIPLNNVWATRVWAC